MCSCACVVFKNQTHRHIEHNSFVVDSKCLIIVIFYLNFIFQSPLNHILLYFTNQNLLIEYESDLRYHDVSETIPKYYTVNSCNINKCVSATVN